MKVDRAGFNFPNDRRMNRRAFVQRLGALGVGMAMVPTLRPARAASDITYFTWSGYDVPELHQKYIEKHGASPNSSYFASEAEGLQKILGGYSADVSHPCIYDLGRWRDSGAIKPIDTSRLKHWPDIFDELKAISGDGDNGQQLIAPFDWGNGSILYRTDLVEIEEESWGLLFDERYAGRLAMWGAIDGAFNAAALAAGVADPFAMTDAEIARVADLLRKQRGLLRFYWEDQTEAEQALASGEVVAAYVWNQSAVALKAQGVPVKFMRPKEGILTWVCGLVLLEGGTGDEAAAYDFIDSMLDPSAGQFLLEAYGYGHANRKSFDLVSAERLEELGLPTDPKEMFTNSIVLSIMDPKVREKYTRLFEEIRAGG